MPDRGWRVFERRARRCLLRFIAVAALTAPATTWAEPSAQAFDLPAQPLGASLQHVAERFGLKIAFYSEFTDGLQAPPLKGRFTLSQAFVALLANTPLEHVFVVPTTVAVRPRPSSPTEGGMSMKQAKRSKPTLIKSLLTGVAAALAAAPAVGADNEGGQEAAYIEEVLVTAEKREESLVDVPIAVVAFTGKSWQHRV